MSANGPLRSGYALPGERKDKREGLANRVGGTPFKPTVESAGASPSWDAPKRNPLGVITSPLYTMSPSDRMQVARQRTAAQALGGTTVNQAAATAAGARDAQAFADQSPQARQMSRLSAASSYSPLAGDAGSFQAMNQSTAANKAQADAAWDSKMNAYKARKNEDANNNGIPDRDEAVATKYGNYGINSINDLSSASTKYNAYMRGYRSNPEAMKTSRPMSFDEFAKASYADYNKRPVYGAESNGEQQQASPLGAAIESGRQAYRDSRTAQRNSPEAQMVRAQRQDQLALNNIMAQASAMGYSPDQAAAIARSQMAINQQLANEQAVRNDAIGLERMRQEAETGRTKMATDAQRLGYETQGNVGLAGVDAQRQASADALKGAMYTADQALAGQQAGFAAQQSIAQDSNATQKYVVDANATNQQKLAAVQAQSAERIRQIEASTQMSIAEKQAAVQREQIQAQSELGKLQAEVQREIGVGQNEVGMAGVQSQERVATGEQANRRSIAELQAQLDRDRSQSAERIAAMEGENRLAIGKQEIDARMAELKEKAADPARRIELQMQLQQMNPRVVAQQAGQRASSEFYIANPNATAPEIQAAGNRAYQAAYAEAVPMWQSIQSDPTLGSFFGNTQVPQGDSPLSQGGGVPSRTEVTQSPLADPQFDMSGGTGMPVVPGPGYQAKNPSGILPGDLSKVVDDLRVFYGGRTPTRAEVEEYIATNPDLRHLRGKNIPSGWNPGSPLISHNPYLGGFSLGP